MRRFLLIFALLTTVSALFAQPKPLHLWKEVQGMKCQPTKLYVYPDSIATGVAVVVCPGGSYSHTMGIATEGFGVAELLNAHGITAFVLKYRTGNRCYHHPAMIQDAQMAILHVRKNAAKYRINPDKVGTMGFSAGGHLVTMTGAFANEDHLSPLGIEVTTSLKPDFVVPVYPVVSMQDSIAHKRSRRNLLTTRYTPEQKQKFSMELSIPNSMPPTLVVTAKDDPVVMYQNSVCLDKALTQAGIRHRFLLYETGGHGYGMDIRRAPEAGQWRDVFYQWLKEINILQ